MLNFYKESTQKKTTESKKQKSESKAVLRELPAVVGEDLPQLIQADLACQVFASSLWGLFRI